jgi:hypothetical protein
MGSSKYSSTLPQCRISDVVEDAVGFATGPVLRAWLVFVAGMPGRKETMISGRGNVRVNHRLDRELYDCVSLGS